MLNIVKWLLVAVPAVYTNAMIEYLQSELGLAYRTRSVTFALILSILSIPLADLSD